MAPNSGKLSDRIHPQKLAAIGMSIATVALLILIFLDANTPLYLIVLAMILQGIGMGLFTTPNTNAIMSSVEKKHYSLAASLLSTTRLFGQVLSVAIMNLILSLQWADCAPREILLQNLQIALLCFALFSAAGVIPAKARN